MTTYTGPTLTWGLARTLTPAGTWTKQTWKIHLPAPMQVSNYRRDIRSAGDYRWTVDGVTKATVNGVAAATNNVDFTPGAPFEIPAGTHTLELECLTGAVAWYSSTNVGGDSSAAIVTGGTYDLVGWDVWEEPGLLTFVHGILSFKLADSALRSGFQANQTSSGSFAAHTWSVTFDTDVYLTGVLKRLRDGDAGGYDFLVDGNLIDNVPHPSTAAVEAAFVPAAPLFLAAGAHTFKCDPVAGNRRWYYRSGTTTVGAGTGASHTTAWGQWQEALGSQCPANIYFRLPEPPGVPTTVVADVLGGSSIELTWAAPAAGTGDPATGYDVRINGGAWTDVGNVLTHTFTGLTANTTYDLEVRAYNAAGDSAAVLVEATTELTGPTEAYHVDLRIGAHTWDIDAADPADPDVPNVLAGATFDWSAPDNVGWPPAEWHMPPDTLTLRVHSPEATDVADVKRFDVVRFAFTPIGYDFDAPLVDFAGVITSDPRITPAPRGGVFLDVTASDWRYVLSLITIFGIDAADGGQHNGEAAPGEWVVAEPDASPIVLVDGGTSLDTLEGPTVSPWGGIDAWVSDALDNTAGFGRGAAYGLDSSVVPWRILQDVVVDQGDVAGVENLHQHYDYGSTLVTLDDVYRLVGIYPFPVFDTGTGPTAGDLITFRWHYVARNGLSAQGVDDSSEPNTFVTLDAVKVLRAAEWRRGFVPDVVDVGGGGVGPTAFDRHWTGEDVGLTEPNPPEFVHRIAYADQRANQFNLEGFAEEVPTSNWGLYQFTVLAHLDPSLVVGWFTYPARVLKVVTVENIEADRQPDGSGLAVGRLSRASLRIDARGRWYVAARLRPRLPLSILEALGE